MKNKAVSSSWKDKTTVPDRKDTDDIVEEKSCHALLKKVKFLYFNEFCVGFFYRHTANTTTLLAVHK